MPKRHYYNRFVKDMKQWARRYVDFMHYTIPINTTQPDKFVFPGEYAGQYGTYEALKFLYQQSSKHKHLANEDSLFVNKKYFAADLE
jgi:hypothetical protein